jgi:hypothetical protein
MDLSKLPKLSQTPSPPVDTDTVPQPSKSPPAIINYERRGQEASPLAEVWISIVIGLILLVMYPTMIKYVSSRLFGTAFAPFELDGTVIPYPKVYPQFWSDLCITAFAFVLILEGVALAMLRKRWIVMFAFGLTITTTLLNVGFVLATFATYGPPIVSLLASAFGGYIAIYQWRLLRSLMVPMASRA